MRRRLIITGVAVAILMSMSGLALADLVGSDDPISTDMQTRLAQQELTFTTSWGKRIVAWSVPSVTGQPCAFFQIIGDSDPPPSFPPSITTANGGYCAQAPNQGDNTFLRLLISYWPQKDGEFAVLVEGSREAGSDVARVVIETAKGTLQSLSSKNGFFVADLGFASARGTLPPPGTFKVEGYDDAGNLVGTIDLAQVVHPTSP
jgi:hypothetical protein